MIRTLDGRVRACCLSILATPQQWLGGRRSKSQPADSKSAALPLELPPSNTSESIPIIGTVLEDVLFRLRGVHGVNQPAIRLANSQILADLGEWLRYPGHLLGYALSQETVTVSHKILRRQFADNKTPLRIAYPPPPPR